MWDERNTDPEAWGFLCSVAEADTGRQLDIVSQLLSRFSDPDAFWALAHSGAAVGDVEVARTRPVATEDAPGWWGTRPMPQFSTTGTVTLPTSADTWYRGLGAHRLQMRDVVSAAVVSAVLSTMVSRNDEFVHLDLLPRHLRVQKGDILLNTVPLKLQHRKFLTGDGLILLQLIIEDRKSVV